MNWKTLRPILRQNFSDFYFYNDLYKSGTRRIKICTQNHMEILNFIKLISPILDVKLFQDGGYRTDIRVTIHYR